MKKIKLAHVQLLPLLSGVQNIMLTLLFGLDREKYEIHVISKPGGPLVEKVKELGFKYIPLPSLRRDLSLLDGLAFLQLFFIFRKNRFDIVHTHSSKTGFLGRIAARLAGVKKIVHTVHGFPFHYAQPLPIRSFYQLLEKFAAFFCDKMIFVNEFEHDFALQYGIVKAEKAMIIHNGIELKEPGQKSIQEKSFFIIGSVLRFEKIKNIENTVKAAIEVCRKNEKIRFYFVGDGRLLNRCRQLVASAGMRDSIIFPGWQNDIPLWLAKFDVYLLYSIAEGLSVSILEAMAAGLPVVASAVKGNNELVSARNGITVPINDIDRLTMVLLSLPARKEDLKRWGSESVNIIKEKFGMKSFIEKYVSIYEH